MDDELHRRVAARIRSLAEQRGILVTHLADRAAVSRTHFKDVLGGRKSPTVAWLGRIAAVLGVDAGDFFVRETV